MALALRHAIRPVITLAAVGASVALVACGGEEASGEDDPANFEDAQVEFAECMRENGVDLPDPETSEGGGGFRLEAGESGIDPESETFQAAQEKCEPIIEDAIPEGERPDPAEIRDQLHQMTECLRDKGYDVPEPQIRILGEDDGDGGAQGESEGPPAGSSDDMEELRDDPEFQQAEEDCAEEAGLPEGGPGGPPGGPDAGGE